jgi:hypothetical protein
MSEGLQSTVELLKQSLEGGSKVSFVEQMKSDFRKLKVIYTCTAPDNKSLCKLYKPTIVGSCSYYGGGDCFNQEEFV